MPARTRVNILLVDDHPENLLALEAVLEDLDQNLVRATSGREALKHLLDEDFAVILLDVQMPEIDGFETARLLRQRERSRNTPILFLTAINKSDEHLLRGYALGAVDYVFKPIVPEVLRAKVAAFVELARKTAELALEVTLREQVEAELRRVNQDLERRVWERTAELEREVRERRRAEQALRERVRLGVVRAEVSAALAAGGDLTGVLQHCAEALARDLAPAFARIWTHCEAEGVLELQASAGEFRDQQDSFTRVPLGEHLVGRVAAQQRPYLTNDLAADPVFGGREWAVRNGMAAIAAYPLLVEQRTVGVMATFSRQSFTEDMLEALASLADGIAQCIDRKRAEAEVRQQAAALAEASRRKDEFLVMLAHELRNPLGAVSNALHVLRISDQHTPQFEGALQAALRQVAHQARLVDDLLDVSLLIRETLDLREERLDLARVVQEASEDYRSRIEREGLSLTLEAPAEAVPVLGDRTRLTQVLGNLLDNAVRFTPTGGRIEVRVGVDPERGEAWVSVRDTGAGIEPEMLPRLFDPLAQADRSLDRSRGGLGLGLALVKGLIERQHGRVAARSGGPGQGAEFTFWLPVQNELPVLQAAPAPPPQASGSLRVLIVEDNREAAETLRDLLDLFGYAVELAYTGPEGLAAARQFRPQVVLCDIGLPGMDGYQVASALRRDPATAPAHLIAVTGYGSDEDRRLSHAAGFEEHLTKPVDPEQLQRLLAEAGNASSASAA